jgi:hypothetical protein
MREVETFPAKQLATQSFPYKLVQPEYVCYLLLSDTGPRPSVGSFRKKSFAKNVSDTERMKNTPKRVCAKTAFVG